MDHFLNENELVPVFIAAKTEASLYNLLENFSKFIEKKLTFGSESLLFHRSFCKSINSGREQNKFSYRAILFSKNITELYENLRDLIEKKTKSNFKFSLKGCEIFRSNENFISFKIDPLKAKTNVSSCESLLESLCQQFVRNANINWSEYYASKAYPHILGIPTYCFEQQRFWPKPGSPIFILTSFNEIALKKEMPLEPREVFISIVTEALPKLNKMNSGFNR